MMPRILANRLATIALYAAICAGTSPLAYAQGDDLFSAAQRGDLAAVNALLKSGVDVNARKAFGRQSTPLGEASAGGHLEVVKALLAVGADVDGGKERGEAETPLILASVNGRADVVQALLSANADRNAVWADGKTALFEAAASGHLDVVKILVGAKADLNVKSRIVGRSALFQALSSNHWDVARFLLESGASPNQTTTTGLTPMMIAAAENSPRSMEMVRMLLAAHADVNGGFVSKSSHPRWSLFDGGSALGVASATGSAEVVQTLLAAISQLAGSPSVAVNAKQPGGHTPLTLASEKGHADVVRLLLAAKADVNAKLPDGSTALSLALQNQHADVASLLRSAGAQ